MDCTPKAFLTLLAIFGELKGTLDSINRAMPPADAPEDQHAAFSSALNVCLKLTHQALQRATDQLAADLGGADQPVH